MIKFVFSLIWILLVATSGNACWTEHNFRGMVQDAQKLTPQNLQWVMDQYQDSFQRGLQQKHNGIRDREVLVQLIIKDSNSAITAFSKDMSYKKGAGFLGRLARSISELHRILTDPGKLHNPDWITDYAIFLQRKRSFFRIRWKGIEQRPKDRKSLTNMLINSTHRIEQVSGILTDTLNKKQKPISTYDVRSAPFGVGCIAYSSAVNTITLTWLYVWGKVGGIHDKPRS
ncbi:hypothetical protein K8T06_16400 [bacterium]|nr:hypothetical protein [bacterium]